MVSLGFGFGAAGSAALNPCPSARPGGRKGKEAPDEESRGVPTRGHAFRGETWGCGFPGRDALPARGAEPLSPTPCFPRRTGAAAALPSREGSSPKGRDRPTGGLGAPARRSPRVCA